MLCALVGALVIGAVGPLPHRGSPTRSPAAAAPERGSCLRSAPPGWRIVNCGEPHTSEVVTAWTSDLSSAAVRLWACSRLTEVYLGDLSAPASTAENWSPLPLMTTTALRHGPDPVLTVGYSWQACTVSPVSAIVYRSGYRGRLADVLATGKLPEDLRACYEQSTNVLVSTSCRSAHVGEVLAARQLRIYGDIGTERTTAADPRVRAQCLDIASRLTGAADPTFGGRLSVVVNLRANGVGIPASRDRNRDAENTYVSYRASCSVETPTKRRLYASMVDLGSKKLPLR